MPDGSVITADTDAVSRCSAIMQYHRERYEERMCFMNAFCGKLRPLIILAFVAGYCSVSAGAPSITISEVPEFKEPGALKGQAADVDFEDHAVAVYIYVSGWWTKPSADEPLTAIKKDGSWECDVSRAESDRIATRYAAFLVPSDYSPPTCMGSHSIPEDLYDEAEAHTAQTRPAGRIIEFSGYRWWVKETFENKAGPGPNWFSGSEENVRVDEQGRLHLRITKVDDQWQCAEVVSLESFGYGTYRVYLDTPVREIDSNAILGLFTWSDSPEYTHREIDVEISKWSDPDDSDNAQFVVQPWHTPGNLERFEVPEDEPATTHCFEWTSKRIKFISYENHYTESGTSNRKCDSWSYSGSVPRAGDENYRINLWLNEGKAPSDGEGMEVIISRFEFVPE
jgi:hypothetical protein